MGNVAVTKKTKRQRSCIACGRVAGKGEFCRIVRGQDGVAMVDETGRVPGRGAYVCSVDCFDAACKTRKLDRALRMTLGSDDYERIAGDVAKALRGA